MQKNILNSRQTAKTVPSLTVKRSLRSLAMIACHSMLHKKKPAYTIEELKQIMR
jgi:predicted HNH restriction endonuclease